MNIGLRDNDRDLIELFDPLLFSNRVENIKKECPTIFSILEQFVLSSNASRNTKKNNIYENESCCSYSGFTTRCT